MAKAKFRRLDYDLYEQLERAKILGSVFQVLLVIIDYTIGYKRDEAAISLTRFQDKTYLSRPTVIRAIRDAYKRRMIFVREPGTNPKAAKCYAINPDFRSWDIRSWGTQKLRRAGKTEFTSKVVKQASPDWSNRRYQPSKTSTMTTPTERNYKESLKKELNITKETATGEVIEGGYPSTKLDDGQGGKGGWGHKPIAWEEYDQYVKEYMAREMMQNQDYAKGVVYMTLKCNPRYKIGCEANHLATEYEVPLEVITNALSCLKDEGAVANEDGKWHFCHVQNGQ